ncbi:hypothetical protein L218DRAFT_949765 [Marasmius fiardii PR-910]|nr:hypothetical protein L218DRAFT_949765 [Marasmius fiardii PR-910]
MQQYSEQNEQNATVDIYQLLQHLTSDVIDEGKWSSRTHCHNPVGFGYKFNAVETDGRDEVVQSHQHVLMVGGKRSKNGILAEGFIPYLSRNVLRTMLQLPLPSFRPLRTFRKISETWAAGLLTDHLRGENGSDVGLLGVVATANNNQKRERLSFNEISHQAGVILVAGQDTTLIYLLVDYLEGSVSIGSLAWALYELAKRPVWQDQVRKKIMEAHQSDSSFDKLEYLNAHIKTKTRKPSVFVRVYRLARGWPMKIHSRPAISANYHDLWSELPIQKGQVIYIGLAAYNRHVYSTSLFEQTLKIYQHPIGILTSGARILICLSQYVSLMVAISRPAFRESDRTLILKSALFSVQFLKDPPPPPRLASCIVLAELIPKFRFSFASEKESEVTSCFGITMVPLNVESGKPSLSMVVQPVQASD